MTQPTVTRVLGALPYGLDSVVGLAVALQLPEHEVLEALQELTACGFVARGGEDGTSYHLTPAGAEAATRGQEITRGRFGSQASFSIMTVRTSRGPAQPDWAEFGAVVNRAWQVARESRDVAREHEEQALLVGDLERESALALLSRAFGEGRLSQEEHDRRTDIVLKAATRGDLDRALDGLQAAEPAAVQSRKIGFWALAGLSAPVLLFALLLLDSEEPAVQALAAVVLVILLPGLLGLAWWSHRHPGPHGHWRP